MPKKSKKHKNVKDTPIPALLPLNGECKEPDVTPEVLFHLKAVHRHLGSLIEALEPRKVGVS